MLVDIIIPLVIKTRNNRLSMTTIEIIPNNAGTLSVTRNTYRKNNTWYPDVWQSPSSKVSRNVMMTRTTETKYPFIPFPIDIMLSSTTSPSSSVANVDITSPTTIFYMLMCHTSLAVIRSFIYSM